VDWPKSSAKHPKRSNAATCRQDRELCRGLRLAPDIQEDILFLPVTTKRKPTPPKQLRLRRPEDPITEHGIRRLLADPSFAL